MILVHNNLAHMLRISKTRRTVSEKINVQISWDVMVYCMKENAVHLTDLPNCVCSYHTLLTDVLFEFTAQAN